ncbi:hypothetical protein BOTCAL_0259g00060 [Botryotinia calthae]|uniref:Uncharacterized protein n=1 Tax=Botryotinia calthae TaxID=38488 RepID=A0A4Y8CYU3_9HELO|nr:hypothetical protein BOTCAL_0259g00060 [Botryotinia calthae]
MEASQLSADIIQSSQLISVDMGGLCIRIDTDVEIFHRSVADLVNVVQQQDIILAQSIEQLARSDNQKVLRLQLRKILQHIDLSKNWPDLTVPQSRESEYISKFISRFDEQQADTQAFIEKDCFQWRENHSLFWNDASCSSNLPPASFTSASICQLWESINDFEHAGNLNPMRRRIALVVFFRLGEQIKKRIQSLIMGDKRRLKNGISYHSITSSVIVENICELKNVSQTEISKIKEKVTRRIRAGKRYAQLQDDMLLKLGKLPVELLQCTTKEYQKVQAYLATLPYSQSYSALIADLQKVFVGAGLIEDAELDAILESGNFNLDQYDQSSITALSDSDVDSHRRATYTENPRDRIAGISSISALLNPADCIARSTEVRQSVQVTSGHGQDSITNEQTESESSGEQSTSLELQVEMGAPSRKRRRLCSSPRIDLPSSQQTDGITHGQETCEQI